MFQVCTHTTCAHDVLNQPTIMGVLLLLRLLRMTTGLLLGRRLGATKACTAANATSRRRGRRMVGWKEEDRIVLPVNAVVGLDFGVGVNSSYRSRTIV